MLCRKLKNVVILSVGCEAAEVEKSGCIVAKPDFSTSFAALTTVEMTFFLQSIMNIE
jgi:hypothetical protein